MELERIRSGLPGKLSSDLPGENAQRNMMARPDSNLRFDMSKRKDARQSGVLILFYEEEGVTRIPLILRHDYGGAHSGQVALPGGRREEQDPTIVDTALREAEEEIGVERTEVEVLGQLSELYIPVSNYLVSPVVGIVDSVPEFVPEEREVRDIIHARLDHLLHPGTVQEKEIVIRGYRVQAPYFDLEGQFVWGATAMILSELKELMLDLE